MFTEAFKSSNHLFPKNTNQCSKNQQSSPEYQQLKGLVSKLRQSKENFKSECQELQSNSGLQVKDFEFVNIQLTQKIIKLKMSRLETHGQ